MRPKYSLTDYTGVMMFERAIKPFLGKHDITIGLLHENEERYPIAEYIKSKYADEISVVILHSRTNGPADTVYQILKRSTIDKDEELFVKDCDSFFEHAYMTGNYICLTNIADHQILHRLGEKSFVRLNDQGIVLDIVEKKVVSDKFCVGGYKFVSVDTFIKSFEQINYKSNREIFISDVISVCLSNQLIFKENLVFEYYDVGTAAEWFKFNDKATIFCDIDGTIIIAQSKQELGKAPVPIVSNILKIKELISLGNTVIFTTSRPKCEHETTEKMLIEMGFTNFQLVTGLPNTKRIIINDYNEANPYPRAIAVNIKRNSNNLGDLL